MKVKDKLHEEIEKGGKEPPCPFCGVPRVKRSDYIRCCGCALNWEEGEHLDHDPRIQRREKFLAVTAIATKKQGAAKE